MRELVAGLAARPEVSARAFAVSFRGRARLADVVPAGVPVRSRPVPARLARLAWQRADHPSAAWLAGPTDVVHGPNYVVPPGGGAAEVVTVSDLSAVRFPEMCSRDVLQWPGLLTRALARGAWVHTISESVGDEVRALHPGAADRVVAVPLAVRRPPPETPATDAAAGRHLAGGPRYVLALGTVEPRKDLPALVAAFDVLAADDPELRLVLAGPDGLGVEALTAARERARHRRRIVRLGWVSDDQRLALLRGAAVVAYASTYEGFGFVPLEAIGAGTPVVATAVGALPEVLADGGLLVPPGDVDALAEGLARVLGDDALVADLLARGQRRLDAYTWDATVGGLVDLYRRAADAR
ncbi:glycosyltransferase family 4 protein [Aquihabitans sp. G128]|uniref:glycosyltransferase family 4 protein n=1 Tax=Aquihabitans sp. G128 TaxID=2849779 RepID=UPI001C20FD8E|nr:glycosyltransferase family 1 protein [Aquihabitans sp. G128]QXC62815.1 glycosyltransferase family 4 protein [Aquihabitans sp. G128]